MHVRRLPSALLLSLAVGCGSGASRVVAIGDGQPRNAAGRSFLEFAFRTLNEGMRPDVRLASWKVDVTGTNQSEAAQAELFAESSDVVAVVGHAGSKGTLIAAPYYLKAGMPVVVPTATSSKLRTAGPLVFMLAPTDSVEGAFIADHALDSLAARRIAVAYVADAYGTGIRDGVIARLTVRGIGPTGEAALSGRECLVRGPLSMTGIVRALLARAHPDLIVVALGSAQAACFISKVRAVDPHVAIVAADSFDPQQPPVIQLSATERAGVRYVDFWNSDADSVSREFTRRFHSALRRDPRVGEALNYDAFQLLFAAIKAGNRSRAAIGRWLRELGTDGHPPFRGVTGPIAFGASRRELLHMRRLPNTAREVP